MKNIVLILFISLLFSCERYNENQLKTLLNNKIDAWHIAASFGNYDDYFDFIADHGIFIGTDISQRWNKHEFSDFAKTYFDQGKGWSFYAKERNITLKKNKEIAWFDEILIHGWETVDRRV